MQDTCAVIDRSLEYLTGGSFNQYRILLQERFPDLFALLDKAAIEGEMIDAYVASMNSQSWEFEAPESGGRGAAYNLAQQALCNRETGMMALLGCFSPSFYGVPPDGTRILDVLGGDGTISRFVNQIEGPRPTIYTADMSRFMIDACLRQGLPCVRQSATHSLIKDDVLDGVLIAYGSHHLQSQERQRAIDEAYRTLRKGGRLVLHDFEEGGRAALWFHDIVHVYSRTGHPHPHFSRSEIWERFCDAGFRDIRVFDLQDPFTLIGATAENAISNAVMHMYHMYDLVKIGNSRPDIVSRVRRCIEETLGQILTHPSDSGFTATIPRTALVAVGTKS